MKIFILSKLSKPIFTFLTVDLPVVDCFGYGNKMFFVVHLISESTIVDSGTLLHLPDDDVLYGRHLAEELKNKFFVFFIILEKIILHNHGVLSRFSELKKHTNVLYLPFLFTCLFFLILPAR